MTRVAVVGGGIAGLAAAHRLRERRPDVEVVVLDAAARVGGKLATAEVAGVVTDTGAEAVLQRRPEAVDLARAVGLGHDVVHPEPAVPRVWSRAELVRMPRSLMGVPVDPDDLADLLSPEGLARAREDLDAPPVVLDGDVSVGDLVAERLGEEVVQRLVEPMLGGVYAGHAHEISARAAVAGLVARLDGSRTLTQAVAAAMAPPPAPGEAPVPVFAGLVGGVGRLPGAVAAASGADVRTGTTVRRLERTATRWRLVTGPVPDPETVDADAVVLAVPAPPAARLLDVLAPAAAAELAGIDYASMAVITLAYRVGDVSVDHGSGFLVPPVEDLSVKGATFSFAKWAWVRAAGAEAGVLVLRCSIGRHREERVLQRDDADLVRVARADLASAAGIRAVPVDHHVQRWGGGLPQYAVGHVERVDRVRRSLSALPGLAVCGAAYDGVGVPAVIGSAHAAVETLLAHLPPPR